MKIALLGARGMLGREIAIQLESNNFEFVGYSSADLDITKPADISSMIQSDTELIINCAAYTDVVSAENDPMAQQVNAIGPALLAEYCNKTGMSLIHFSTDYVFDGNTTVPYTETAQPNPINAYGASKLDGETNIQDICNNPYFILRTSWLYGEYGNCFPKRIYRKYLQGGELKVVDDQFGTPTNATLLSLLTLKLIQNHNSVDRGIYHAVNSGQASWYEFAKTVSENLGMQIPIERISTHDSSTNIERPSYSVLDNTKITNVLGVDIPHWKESLSKSQMHEWIE